MQIGANQKFKLYKQDIDKCPICVQTNLYEFARLLVQLLICSNLHSNNINDIKITGAIVTKDTCQNAHNIITNLSILYRYVIKRFVLEEQSLEQVWSLFLCYVYVFIHASL